MFGIRSLTNRTWGMKLKYLGLEFATGFVEEVTLNMTSEAIELPLGDNVPIVFTTVASTVVTRSPGLKQQILGIVAGSLPNMLI